MAWKTKISIDDKSTGVGTATATFTYDDLSTFAYTSSIELINSDSFVQAAKTAKTNYDAKISNENSYETTFDNKFLEE